jgi:hypothetical protein
LLGEFGQQAQLGCLMFPSASAGCGNAGTGFAQSYSASLEAGEVLQFGVDTTHSTYSYQIIQSSYGIPLGSGGSGSILGQDPDGSYELGASSDNFVQGGNVFPVQNGLLVGHLVVMGIGGTNKIPVFGVSGAITALADLAGTYNYEGFSCKGQSKGNPAGTVACGSSYGSLTADSLGNVSQCKSGDIDACPVSVQSGVVTATATPGIFNYTKAGVHKGWFFAFVAGNGQKVAVLDRDDTSTPEYGHSVAVTRVTLAPGQSDGTYFVKNNLGQTHTVVVSGTSYTSTNHPGFTGTLTYNSPWAGMVRYSIDSSSGIAMASATGAYTDISDQVPYKFSVGLRH